MEIYEKLVRFDLYCKTCKYALKSESEDPCWDCLDNPVNTYSRKPVYWEKGEEPKKTPRK